MSNVALPASKQASKRERRPSQSWEGAGEGAGAGEAGGEGEGEGEGAIHQFTNSLVKVVLRFSVLGLQVPLCTPIYDINVAGVLWPPTKCRAIAKRIEQAIEQLVGMSQLSSGLHGSRSTS